MFPSRSEPVEVFPPIAAISSTFPVPGERITSVARSTSEIARERPTGSSWRHHAGLPLESLIVLLPPSVKARARRRSRTLTEAVPLDASAPSETSSVQPYVPAYAQVATQ